jgi:hypothetical protein
VSADFLTTLLAEIAQARARLPEDRHTLAVQELAERFGLPVEGVPELLAALDAQPGLVREPVLRRFVEAWL